MVIAIRFVRFRLGLHALSHIGSPISGWYHKDIVCWLNGRVITNGINIIVLVFNILLKYIHCSHLLSTALPT